MTPFYEKYKYFYDFLVDNYNIVLNYSGYENDKFQKRTHDKDILEEFPKGYNEMEPPKWELNPIGVNHLSGTAGTLLCEMISCHPLFGGEEFYQSLLQSRKTEGFHWGERHSRWHPRVHRYHNDDVDIEIIPKFEKFIHVSYDNTPEEREYLLTRLSHMTHTRMTKNRFYTNLQLKYIRIVQDFLRKNHTNWFEFPFMAFAKDKPFINYSIKMFEYLEIEPLPTEIISKIYKSWRASEIKHAKLFKEHATDFDIRMREKFHEIKVVRKSSNL